MTGFIGARTFTDAAGNTRRTSAYNTYLANSGIGRAPAAGTPPPIPVGARPPVNSVQVKPALNITPTTHVDPKPTANGPVGTPPAATPPPLSPDQLFRSFIDGTYRAKMRSNHLTNRNALDALQAKRVALTEKRPEYGGGTMYDKLLADANAKFNMDRRGLADQMAKRGILVSGAHNRNYGDLSKMNADQALDLDRNYGARAVGDIDLDIGRANRTLLEDNMGAAEELIDRARAGGQSISNQSIEAMMQLLNQYGGALPVGGQN